MANNFFQGLGHGLLGLVGMGEFFDPLGGEKAELQKSMQTLQTHFRNGTMQALTGINTNIKELFTLTESNKDVIERIMNFYNEKIYGNLQETNMFVATLYMLVIIIIFFYLVK